MENKEILEKLKNLNDLLTQYREQQDYIENGCAREAAEGIIAIQNAVAVMPGVPSVVNAMPVFPISDAEYKKAKEETEQSAKITMIALIATAASLLLWLFTQSGFLCFIGVVAGFAWFILNKNHRNDKQGLTKKEKAYQDSVENSKRSFEKFRKALSCYSKEVEDGITAAKSFGEFYRNKYAEYEKVLSDYDENRENAIVKFSILSVEIEEHDYISEEYHHFVPKLISLLQSGRAASYKEALNMAIEEERQDAMEAARQQEEARRLAAMERQAEEERRHNMMMERQQAAHDRAMERVAQEQAEAQRRATIQAQKDRDRAEREARIQREEEKSNARKQANATRMAGVSKCASCANSRKCPSHVKESGAGLTCGGYRPYGS